MSCRVSQDACQLSGGGNIAAAAVDCQLQERAVVDGCIGEDGAAAAEHDVRKGHLQRGAVRVDVDGIVTRWCGAGEQAQRNRRGERPA